MTNRNTMGGSMAARPREDVENKGDPRGRFALFLRDWIDRKHGGSPKPLAESLGLKVRSVQTWMQGKAGPAFGDLDTVARALGYADWSKLAAAVERFNG